MHLEKCHNTQLLVLFAESEMIMEWPMKVGLQISSLTSSLLQRWVFLYEIVSWWW